MPLPNAWWAWATTAGRNALIVLNEPTGEVVEALVGGAGAQVQCLVLTSLSPEQRALRQKIFRLFGEARVRAFRVAGYTAAELTALVSARGLRLNQSTQQQLEYARVCLRGDPVRVRAVVELACTHQPLTDENIVQHLTVQGHLNASPPLPYAAEWIERPALRAVREQLTRGTPLVIVHGPPGIGKTTLVAQLRQDPALRLYFSDGLFLIPGFEGEPHATRLSERYVEYLADSLQVPLESTLPRAEALQRALAGRRCLLILEDGQAAAFIRHLRQCLPLPMALVVTTRRSAVAEGVDRPAVVLALTHFTWEEVEAYYRQRCQHRGETVSAADLAALGQLYHLTGGHPLALCVSLALASAQGWTRVLSFLQNPPALEESGLQKELYQPLALAYASLGASLQKRFASLGALPLLAFYDRLTFTALWRAGTDVDETLKVLEHDAGLVQSYDLPEGERVWRLHSQVWAYARRLYEMAEPPERQAAAQWLERAVRTPSQQKRYQEFRQGIARLGWRTWWRYAVEHYVPAGVPLWKRQLYFLIKPGYVAEWQVFQEHARYFTSAELMLAYQLYREERTTNYWWGVLYWLDMAMIVLWYLPAPSWFLGMVLALMLLSWGIVVIRYFTLEWRRMPAWRRLWLTARQRMQSPPPEPLERLAQWLRLIRHRGLARSV